MFKDSRTRTVRDGQLYVIETSSTRKPAHWIEDHTGIELAIAYLNLFSANNGWTPISGGNFSRLRNAFTVNPLLNVAAGNVRWRLTELRLGCSSFGTIRTNRGFLNSRTKNKPTRLCGAWGCVTSANLRRASSSNYGESRRGVMTERSSAKVPSRRRFSSSDRESPELK